jgi:hypothetical protein
MEQLFFKNGATFSTYRKTIYPTPKMEQLFKNGATFRKMDQQMEQSKNFGEITLPFHIYAISQKKVHPLLEGRMRNVVEH